MVMAFGGLPSAFSMLGQPVQLTMQSLGFECISMLKKILEHDKIHSILSGDLTLGNNQNGQRACLVANHNQILGKVKEQLEGILHEQAGVALPRISTHQDNSLQTLAPNFAFRPLGTSVSKPEDLLQRTGLEAPTDKK